MAQTVTVVGRRKNGRRILRITETGAADTGLNFQWAPAYRHRLLGIHAVYSASPTHAGVTGFVGRNDALQLKIASGAGSVQTQDVASYDPYTKIATLSDRWRTNTVVYSEQLDNAAWTKTGVSVNANSAVAPDGATTMDEIIEDGTSSHHMVRKQCIITMTSQFVFSAYAKAGARNYARMGLGNARFSYATFNLSTGAWGSIAGTEAANLSVDSEYVGGGIYRLFMSGAFGTTDTAQIWFGPNDGTNGSYTGNSTGSIHGWGLQWEQTTAPTEYSVMTANPVAMPDNTSVYQVLNADGSIIGTGTASAGAELSLTLAADPIFGARVLSGSANAQNNTLVPTRDVFVGDDDRIVVLAPAGGGGITASVAVYVEEA